jgi:hypothetical protein
MGRRGLVEYRDIRHDGRGNLRRFRRIVGHEDFVGDFLRDAVNLRLPADYNDSAHYTHISPPSLAHVSHPSGLLRINAKSTASMKHL